MSAAFSPIVEGALVLPEVSVGMIEATQLERPWRSRALTTITASVAGADRVVGRFPPA
jgi:hypothetical protein